MTMLINATQHIWWYLAFQHKKANILHLRKRQKKKDTLNVVDKLGVNQITTAKKKKFSADGVDNIITFTLFNWHFGSKL